MFSKREESARVFQCDRRSTAKERGKKYSHTAVDLTAGAGLWGLINKGVFEKKGYLVIRSISVDL